MQPATRSSNQPLGTSGGWRRRLLRHHVPLALASAVVLVLFMTLPSFDANKYPVVDIFTGWFPGDFPAGQTGSVADGAEGSSQGAGHTGPPQGAEHAGPPQADGADPPLLMRRFTFATGYVATGLLGFTLLVGPANLLLRKRNPVSSYLRRDVGAWAAIGSGVHVTFGFLVDHGGEGIPGYFVAPGGGLMTNSFGLGNYTGLAALVIVAGLLALSSDFALRKLKARRWKWLQRLNYALFALVIVHAFFYGALLRVESPYTLLLGLGVIAVFVGQAVGVWLRRRRYSRTTASQPA